MGHDDATTMRNYVSDYAWCGLGAVLGTDAQTVAILAGSVPQVAPELCYGSCVKNLARHNCDRTKTGSIAVTKQLVLLRVC